MAVNPTIATLQKPLQPGATIGILGGGQLGRMLAMAAARLGFKTVVLEPGKNCPASQTCNHHVEAAYDSKAALAELASACDVVTYEFENIPNSAVRYLETELPLLPGALALEKSQDRLTEKEFLNANGIATAPFFPVSTLEDLVLEAQKPGFDGILKTRRLGYDGKGQARIKTGMTQDQLKEIWDEVGDVPCILEGFVGFRCEISVIAARGIDGSVKCFDPAENVHKNGILHTSVVPAGISAETAARAYDIAAKILEALEYVGVLGVEFFVGKDETLIVNEIAPRVHNSGHWTEAACPVSQFEQHIRAIAGLPLADTARHSDCSMENLIGNDVAKFPELLAKTNVKLHLYGKSEVKPGRKMGHYTAIYPKGSN